MRLWILGLILFLSNINFLAAKTFISQDITQNQYWTKERSPYIITNDIVIHPHVILNIQAGTEIQFSSGVTLYVEGSIWAVGKAKKTIMWRGFQDNIWNGIVFRKSKNAPSIDTTINVFRHCHFEGKAYFPENLIFTEGRHLEMKYCSIRACNTALQSEKSAYIDFQYGAVTEVYRVFHIGTTSSMKIQQCKIENYVLMLVSGSLDFKFNKVKHSIAHGQHTGLIFWLIGAGHIEVAYNQFIKAEEAAITLYKSVRKNTIHLANNKFKQNKINLAISCEYANKGNFILKDNSFYKSKASQIFILDDCAKKNDTLRLAPNYFPFPKQAKNMPCNLVEYENDCEGKDKGLILEFEGFLLEKPKFTPLNKK